MIEFHFDVGGAVAFWTVCEFTDRDRLKAGLHPLGLEQYVPDPRPPASVLRDALEEALGGARVLIHPLADQDGFTVVKAERGKNANAYATDLVARVRNPDLPNLEFDPYDARAARVNDAFRRHAGRVPAVQLSACLVKVVEHRGGTRLRPTGAVYWIPGHRLDEWAAVARAVEAASEGKASCVYLLRHRLDADAVRAVRDAVVAEVAREAARISEDVQAGDLGWRAAAPSRTANGSSGSSGMGTPFGWPNHGAGGWAASSRAAVAAAWSAASTARCRSARPADNRCLYSTTLSRRSVACRLRVSNARQSAEADAARRLAAARGRLILGRDAKSAFFATLALRLTLEADWNCGTMATDGRVLAYDPTFVTGLSPDELLGVLAHEVLHNALGHPFRRGGRDAKRWNVACDLAVNPLLLAAGYVLPASRLLPGEGPYAHLPTGKAADEYYALLEEARPPDEASGPASAVSGEDGGIPDPGGCGGVADPAAGTPAGREQTAAGWRVAVAQAEQVAKGRGDLPAGLARTVADLRHPPLDWRAVRRAFVAAAACNDYSWSRPNRRYVWKGLYLPGLHSEELGDVVIAVDTSGSIADRHLAAFAAEVNGILSAFDGTATVLYHDTRVQGVQTWRSTDGPLALDPVGGGGTSHACVFDWVGRQGTPPACVVCLTDLETRFPDAPPAVRVLWAVVGGTATQPPFGNRIDVGTA